MKLLCLRFGAVPEEIGQRLRSASPAELELWAERVLTARSAGEVMGG